MNQKKKRQYTDDFKQDAVKLVTEQGYSAAEAARNLGVDSSNLRRWIINDRAENELSSTLPAQMSDKQARLRELEKENKKLRMERDILKKAATFFANESN